MLTHFCVVYGCVCATRIFSLLSACEALTEWEYLPPVGPRPPKGFVGLKNAGATCYMNSVIQQLYICQSHHKLATTCQHTVLLKYN